MVTAQPTVDKTRTVAMSVPPGMGAGQAVKFQVSPPVCDAAGSLEQGGEVMHLHTESSLTILTMGI